MSSGGDKRAPVGRFGGVRMVQRRIGQAETLHQNKEAVAQELIALGTANITDVVNLDGTIKPIDEIPDHALRAIKKISVRGDDVTIEMHDKVSVLRVLAKASGMLDAEENVDKPSIVGINMKGPTIDMEDVDENAVQERGTEADGSDGFSEGKREGSSVPVREAEGPLEKDDEG